LEVGYIDVVATPGTEHASEVAGRFFSFHTDTFQIPPGATLLAASDRYPQAWSYGSALGLQFHPEISLEGIRQLLEIEGEKISRAGTDVEAIRAEAEAHAARAQQSTEMSIGRWLDRSLKARVDFQESAFSTSAESTPSSAPQLSTLSTASWPLSPRIRRS
jgi:GMP synthase (glutamine-hydrolysing)